MPVRSAYKGEVSMQVQLARMEEKDGVVHFTYACAVQDIETRKTLMVTMAMKEDAFHRMLMAKGLERSYVLLEERAGQQADEIIEGRITVGETSMIYFGVSAKERLRRIVVNDWVLGIGWNLLMAYINIVLATQRYLGGNEFLFLFHSFLAAGHVLYFGHAVWRILGGTFKIRGS